MITAAGSLIIRPRCKSVEREDMLTLVLLKQAVVLLTAMPCIVYGYG